MKSARLSLNASQIHTALNASALDNMAPGVDLDSGLGIVMALGAVQSLTTPVTINSIPAGLTFSISGASCPVGTYTTPMTLNWSLATSCSVSFPSPQNFGEHTLHVCHMDGREFSDPRVITTPTVATTLHRSVDRSARNHQIVRRSGDRPGREYYAFSSR